MSIPALEAGPDICGNSYTKNFPQVLGYTIRSG